MSAAVITRIMSANDYYVDSLRLPVGAAAHPGRGPAGSFSLTRLPAKSRYCTATGKAGLNFELPVSQAA